MEALRGGPSIVTEPRVAHHAGGILTVFNLADF
jgi:hypothetical protein